MWNLWRDFATFDAVELFLVYDVQLIYEKQETPRALFIASIHLLISTRLCLCFYRASRIASKITRLATDINQNGRSSCSEVSLSENTITIGPRLKLVKPNFESSDENFIVIKSERTHTYYVLKVCWIPAGFQEIKCKFYSEKPFMFSFY